MGMDFRKSTKKRTNKNLENKKEQSEGYQKDKRKNKKERIDIKWQSKLNLEKKPENLY